MAFTFARQTRFFGRRSVAYGLGLVAFGGLSTMNYFNSLAQREERVVKKAKADLEDFNVRTIIGSDAVDYPWMKQNLDEWEYQLIKIRGFFREQRIYVKKYKDGKPGYAVFAPFYTAVYDTRTNVGKQITVGTDMEIGIMVNLGWIPKENKDEVSGTDEPLPLVEWDEESVPFDVTDPDTGFIYKSKYDEDNGETKPKYTDLTAVVRRGEKYNPIIGNVNFPKENLFQFIDLDLFTRVFSFHNHDSARVAYLERIVPSLDDSGN